MSLVVEKALNIADAFFKQAAATPERLVCEWPIAEPSDHSSSVPRVRLHYEYKRAAQDVARLATFFHTLGVTPKTPVAILSGSRAEWMLADLAILSCGGISVSVYQSLLAEDIGYILFDSGAKIVVAENQEQVDKLLALHGTSIRIPATEDREATTSRLDFTKIIAIEVVEPHPLIIQWTTILEDTSLSAEVPAAITSITADDTAALVYTSGTTGPPKGVIQTHGNHLANVRQAYESELVSEDSSLALLLPLAHSFAKLIGYIGFLSPATIKFAAVADRKSSKLVPQSISKDLKEGSATIVPLVPRLIEKMREGIISKSHGKGLGPYILKRTVDSAQRRYAAIRDGKSVSLIDSIVFALTAPIRRKIRNELFGPNFKFCVSGGAKLPNIVAEFFLSLEMIIIEGYGLTETCVATNVGRVRRNKIGTVGPVLSHDIEMRLAEDGEILFRGPNVAKGYHLRPTATRNAWDSEGWYHTGDLGVIDSDGYLSIVGRKKDIIVTSGGKNIAPHEIETKIKECTLISQAVLIGDGRKYLVAVLTLAEPEVKKWRKANSALNPDTPAHACERVVATIWEFVSEVNKTLASFETVKKIFIAPEDFTVDNGMMTPTFKVKRAEVEKRYQKEIDAMFPS